MKRLTVAVIGCGVVTQARHLPALTRLADRFELTALCDTDPAALAQATPWAPNAAQVTSIGELFSRPEGFDAVLIATSGDHVAEFSAAVTAGKHIFVEKPLAFTSEQAEPLVRQVDAAGVTCVVGYMKRYSPAVRRALSRVQTPAGLRIVRCDLVHPPEDSYLRWSLGRTRPQGGSLLDFVRHEVTRGAGAQSISRVLRDAPVSARVGYFLLASSVIHDINLLRIALGELQVANASFWENGLCGQATLRNASGATAILTYVFVRAGGYCETLSLVDDNTRVAVSFPSPYLLHAPVRLLTQVPGDAEAPCRDDQELFHDDLFYRELLAFHEHAIGNREADTTASDALADLELAAAIARAAAKSEHDIRHTAKGQDRDGLR
jgi:predicted dehydrogenase